MAGRDLPGHRGTAYKAGAEIHWCDEVAPAADEHPVRGYGPKEERATMDIPNRHVRPNRLAAINKQHGEGPPIEFRGATVGCEMHGSGRALPGFQSRLVDYSSLAGEVVLIFLGPAGLLFLCYRVFAASGDLDQWLHLEDNYYWLLSCEVVLLPLIAAGFLSWRHYMKPRSFLGLKGILASVGSTLAVSLLSYYPVAFLSLDHEYQLRKARAEALVGTVNLTQLAEEGIFLLNSNKSSPGFATLSPRRGELPGLIESLHPVYVDIYPDAHAVHIVLVVRPFDPVGNEGFDLTERRDKGSYELEWVGEYENKRLLVSIPINEKKDERKR